MVQPGTYCRPGNPPVYFKSGRAKVWKLRYIAVTVNANGGRVLLSKKGRRGGGLVPTVKEWSLLLSDITAMNRRTVPQDQALSFDTSNGVEYRFGPIAFSLCTSKEEWIFATSSDADRESWIRWFSQFSPFTRIPSSDPILSVVGGQSPVKTAKEWIEEEGRTKPRNEGKELFPPDPPAAPESPAPHEPEESYEEEVERGPPEMRIDIEDGEAYTKEEFIEYYGGVEEWESAPRAPRGSVERPFATTDFHDHYPETYAYAQNPPRTPPVPPPKAPLQWHSSPPPRRSVPSERAPPPASPPTRVIHRHVYPTRVKFPAYAPSDNLLAGPPIQIDNGLTLF
eukprot:Sspe_Gene.95365::Locus_67664_Transcript_1_1_Confidence_1.000_Length_1138::g.95365::m.95365